VLGIDDDVAEGMGALAATFETASRGLIYDHRPASLPAERLTAALKPMLAEAGRSTGTAFDRDAAVVLRRIETAARDIRAINREDRRAFLDLLGRIITRTAGGPGADAGTDPADHSSLILP